MPTFTTTFTKPAAPTAIVLTPDTGFARMRVDWTAVADTYFFNWRVYRSIEGKPWVRVDPGTLNNPAVKTFTDEWGPVFVNATYRVTQSNGSIESDPIEGTSRIPVGSLWISVPGDDSNTLEIPLLSAVTETPYADDEVFRPLGRWNAMVVGDLEGSSEVSLEFLLGPGTRHYYDQIREMFAMVRRGETNYLVVKEPHGGVYLVAARGSLSRVLEKGGYEKISIPAVVVDG